MFIFIKKSFCFLLLLEAFLKSSELLSIIDKVSLKLHGKLTYVSKYLNNKIQIMKKINQKALRDSYKFFD